MLKDLLKHSKWFLLFGVLLTGLYGATEVFCGILYGQIFDSAEGNIDVAYYRVLIRLGCTWLVNFGFFWGYQYINKHLVRTSSAGLKKRVFDSLINSNQTKFHSSDTGQKVSILTNDIHILENDFYGQVFQLVHYFYLMIFTIIVMFSMSPVLTLFLVAVAAVSFVVSKFATKNLDKYKEEVSAAASELVSKSTECFNGYSTIRSYNIMDFIFGNLTGHIQNLRLKELKFDRRKISFALVPYSMSIITFVACAIGGGYFISRKYITSGQYMTFMNLVNNITMPTFMVIDITASIRASKSIWQKIQNLAPVQEGQLQGLTVAKHDFTRSLDARGIKFGYGEKTVLDGISCSFEPGKKYLVVGLSGSGKSTFLKLLDRREVPNEGKLYMDGVDYNSIQESSLLDLVSFVEQQVFLFKGSLWDNITLYSKPKEDRVRELLCQVGLEYMQDSLYDSEFVSENGNSLSGGEKQRVSIARALLKGNKVLLADEVLASLDNENSQRIEKLLLELEGITVVSVSHRLNPDLLSRYHNILVFNKGHIVESGSYAELCGKKDSYLMRLVNIEEM